MNNKNSNNKVMTINDVLSNAKKYKEHEQYDKAINLYNQIINNYPNNFKALFERAKLYNLTEKYYEALNDLDILLNLPVSKHIVHIHIADTLKALKKYDEAIENYLEAIDIKPDYEATYVPVINIMIMNNQFDKAVEIVDKGINNLPNSSDLVALKAKVYSKLKDFDQAEEWYKKAIDFGLNDRIKHVILTEYAIVKEKLGKYDEAMDIAKKANIAAQIEPAAKHHTTERIDNFITSAAKYIDTSQWKSQFTYTSNNPIFLMGFPRSGTTLMEQILYTNKNLVVTDEPGVMSAINFNLDHILNRQFCYPDDFNTITNSEIEICINNYFLRIKNVLADYNPNLRIVDKDPMSFIYLLSVKIFFPKSSIIMMIRDPRGSVAKTYLLIIYYINSFLFSKNISRIVD